MCVPVWFSRFLVLQQSHDLCFRQWQSLGRYFCGLYTGERLMYSSIASAWYFENIYNMYIYYIVIMFSEQNNYGSLDNIPPELHYYTHKSIPLLPPPRVPGNLRANGSEYLYLQFINTRKHILIPSRLLPPLSLSLRVITHTSFSSHSGCQSCETCPVIRIFTLSFSILYYQSGDAEAL